ncbi:MAG: hypothetical protein MUF18_01220 [Fimbriiglobus sp.]|jgi:hypothetical protein|nr:hypothetical protein [Fimbriiglobus sp.]
MVQAYRSWEPLPDLPPFFGDYELRDGANGLTVWLRPGVYPDGREYGTLRLSFGRSALAYRVHEEHTHPRFGKESGVEASPGWAWGPHPCMVVEGSEWVAGFSDSQLLGFRGSFTHYFLYTLSNTIDVLANREPSAAWAEPPA